MKGQAPFPALSCVARESEPGLYELVATNSGTGDARIPGTITAHWSHSRLVAADGLADFQANTSNDESLTFTRQSNLGPPLSPDSSFQLGWIRLDHPAEISLDAPDPQ
jgi:hypothetical protein